MIRGSCVALATPFREDGAVDLEQVRESIEWHIASGTQGVVLCGTTGEAPTLSDEEMLEIFATGVATAKGRIPIIAGTGSYNTQHSVHLTQKAQALGVDAALIIAPYYNRPHPEGCFLHFQKLAEVGLPLIIYHNPVRTGICLPVSVLARICALPNMVAVKESTGNLDYAIELMQQTDLPLVSGDDTLLLPLIASGAVGVISMVANVIPEEWQRLNAMLLEGNFTEGRALFRRLYPLVKSMVLEVNPQCVKYALSLLGKGSPAMRLPLIEPQENTKEQIRLALDAVYSVRSSVIPGR